MSNRTIKNILLVILALLGLAFFLYQYKAIYLSAHINIRFNRQQIIDKARQSLLEWGYEDDRYQVSAQFRVREALLRYLQKSVPADSLELVINEKLPAYYWAVTWKKQDNRKNITPVDTTRLFPAWFNQVGIHYDQNGNEIAFWVEAAEDSSASSVSEQAARAIADSLWFARLGADTSLFAFSKIKTINQEKRVDYSVFYNRKSAILQIPVQLQIDILGTQIGKFEYTFEKLDKDQTGHDGEFNLFASLFVIVGLIVLYVISLLKKIRNDEISIKASIPAGIILILCSVLTFLLKLEQWDTGSILGGLIIGPLFMGFFGVIAVACADAVTRDAWNDKLLTFDALMRGKVRHRLFANSILYGLASGLILVGFSTFLISIFSMSSPVDLTGWSSDVTDLNSYSPFIYRFTAAITNIVWTQFVFVLFVSSFLARYFNKRRWIVLSAAIIWAFGMGVNEFISHPEWLAILYYFCIGAGYVIIFLAFDFVTSLVSQVTFILVFESVRFLHFNNRQFLYDGIGYDLILFALLMLGLAGLKKVIERDELLRYSPRHVKKLFERERLKRELEIAKRVQLSFLPRSTPNIPHLDVASICYPAEEVGGDYYDFIKIDDKKLGIAIGDVSGKGISAAFYMTLTKGFLRSLTRTPLSPSQVLIEMNSLFFENVERNHFVSMIYGIFDVEKMELTFARAGHNPVINRKNDASLTQIICPQGLALGMDKGNIFNSVIEERNIPIKSGDIFVFYTDGFTEAMNEKNQEFGEQRLENLITQIQDEDSSSIINMIKKSVKDFTGSMAQHDDMTMLIVRIN